MKAELAWWDLEGSGQTIDSLNAHLRDGATRPWVEVPGLVLKLWIADREHNAWGALMVWEHDRPADRPLPANRAAELIGCPPTHRMGFEVAAGVEGLHTLATLQGIGPVFAA
ncbi:hypothetical protein ACFP1Z_22140 [Streptomyces gamaensis]|uniref:Uncharacterized protein n=1 Tax=Streptomyces gamaensis TaxID=1763542 RepID=A0ABW0Z209_9ACTN